jgi:hypothetical protein
LGFTCPQLDFTLGRAKLQKSTESWIDDVPMTEKWLSQRAWFDDQSATKCTFMFLMYLSHIYLYMYIISYHIISSHIISYHIIYIYILSYYLILSHMILYLWNKTGMWSNKHQGTLFATREPLKMPLLSFYEEFYYLGYWGLVQAIPAVIWTPLTVLLVAPTRVASSCRRCGSGSEGWWTDLGRAFDKNIAIKKFNHYPSCLIGKSC